MKIEILTSEQEALLPVVRDKWIQLALSTEPADRERAEEGVRKAYATAGLREPRMVWVESPEAMVMEIKPSWNSIWDQVREQVWYQVLDQVLDQVYNQVWYQARGQVRGQVQDQVWERVWGQVWERVWGQVWERVSGQVYPQVSGQVSGQVVDPSYLTDMARFDFYRRAGLKGLEPLEGLMEIMEQTCWWAPFKDTCFLCERPERLLLDNEGRLHCENGPAVEYKDGWSVYSWHGTTIPKEWIMGTPPTASEALTWPRIEQRRCAAEILGWDRILGELDPKVIDEDSDPEIGTLLRVDLPDSPGEQFLRVRCGTGRDFVLPVPPEVTSAREANASTWGLDPHEYNPEVRT